jgi:hypothetical protein
MTGNPEVVGDDLNFRMADQLPNDGRIAGFERHGDLATIA